MNVLLQNGRSCLEAVISDWKVKSENGRSTMTIFMLIENSHSYATRDNVKLLNILQKSISLHLEKSGLIIKCDVQVL